MARCVQEPGAVLQDHYSKPQIITTVLDRAPIDQILETAKRNRAGDLEQLSPQHRALVEARMKELVYWIDANTTITMNFVSVTSAGQHWYHAPFSPMYDVATQQLHQICLNRESSKDLLSLWFAD